MSTKKIKNRRALKTYFSLLFFHKQFRKIASATESNPTHSRTEHQDLRNWAFHPCPQQHQDERPDFQISLDRLATVDSQIHHVELNVLPDVTNAAMPSCTCQNHVFSTHSYLFFFQNFNSSSRVRQNPTNGHPIPFFWILATVLVASLSTLV